MGRRMGSDSFSSSGGADSDNWGRKKEERDNSIPPSGGQRRGVGFEFSAAYADNWVKNKDLNTPAVAVNGGSRPRLNLQRKTLPVSNEGQEAKPKGSNPFGYARPREEVLKDKGQDWKEIDEKLEAKIKEGTSVDVSVSRGFGFGNVKEDLNEKRTWRKPASVVDNVEKEVAEKTEEVAAEENENGDAENN